MYAPEDKKNLLIPAAIVLAGLIIALAIVYAQNGFNVRLTPQPADQDASSAPSVDDDPAIGSAGAPVTMIEFSDFECPFCGRFWSETLPEIKRHYVETGKVRFVYRDFPINAIHANAEKAAEAAECADEQNQFWEYHDLIFQHQDQLGVENFRRWARELDMDGTRFDSCLDSGRYAAEVAGDFSDGQAAGVSGTPTFFINGRRVVGALPFAEFQSILDAALVEAR